MILGVPLLSDLLDITYNAAFISTVILFYFSGIFMSLQLRN